MQSVVRMLVALLALAGATGAALTGYIRQGNLEHEEKEACKKYHVQSMDEAVKQIEATLAQAPASEIQKYNAERELSLRESWGAWILYAAGGLALVGTFLAVLGWGKSAAVILLAAPVGPAVILRPPMLRDVAKVISALSAQTSLEDLFLALALIAMLAAGLLAFLIRTPKRPAPAAEE